jgi:hypothetical protein
MSRSGTPIHMKQPVTAGTESDEGRLASLNQSAHASSMIGGRTPMRPRAE